MQITRSQSFWVSICLVQSCWLNELCQHETSCCLENWFISLSRFESTKKGGRNWCWTGCTEVCAVFQLEARRWKSKVSYQKKTNFQACEAAQVPLPFTVASSDKTLSRHGSLRWFGWKRGLLVAVPAVRWRAGWDWLSASWSYSFREKAPLHVSYFTISFFIYEFLLPECFQWWTEKQHVSEPLLFSVDLWIL